MSVAELAALGRLRGDDVAAEGPRHQLIYLAEQALVVVPYCRLGEGRWEAAVVGTRRPHRVGPVTLTDAQVAQAATVVNLDPVHDPDGWARLWWQPQVFRHFRGGPIVELAALIAAQLRPQLSLQLPATALEDHAWIAARLSTTRAPAVTPLLARLAGAGFLTQPTAHLWRLTVPPEMLRQP